MTVIDLGDPENRKGIFLERVIAFTHAPRVATRPQKLTVYLEGGITVETGDKEGITRFMRAVNEPGFVNPSFAYDTFLDTDLETGLETGLDTAPTDTPS